MVKQGRNKEEIRKKVKCLLQYYRGGEPEELLEIIKEEIDRDEKCKTEEGL